MCGWWWLDGWWSDKTILVLISTQVKVVVEVGLGKVLKINFHGWVGGGGWGWVAGSIGNKTFSAFNQVEVEVEVEAELGNMNTITRRYINKINCIGVKTH